MIKLAVKSTFGTDRGDWMQSYLGGAFYPADPRPDEIFIEDIAHALSMQCRYGGHCDRFYSIAEHGYWMSLLVSDHAYVALHHDDPEAYLLDIPTPEKKLLRDYGPLEARWWRIVSAVLGCRIELPAAVVKADADICLSERDANMKRPPMAWRLKECGFRIRIRCWSPRKAEKMFLRRHRQLIGAPLSWWDRLALSMNQLKYLNNKKLQKETLDAPHRYSRPRAMW